VWRIEESSFFGSKFKRYQKDHRSETLATLNNFDTYFKALQSVSKPVLVRAGFIHPEKNGVIAIDESGMGGKPHKTRFYIYASEDDQVVHLITIGDKNSQNQDLADCRSFMKNLKRSE